MKKTIEIFFYYKKKKKKMRYKFKILVSQASQVSHPKPRKALRNHEKEPIGNIVCH